MFSHKEVIRDLICGFVKQDWIKELDFDSLERVSDSFVTDDIRDREDDTHRSISYVFSNDLILKGKW